MGAAVHKLGPLDVPLQTREQAITSVTTALAQRTGISVAFANTHLLYHAVRDAALAGALKHFVILNDGVGVHLLARLCCGQGFPENLNGTDLTPAVLAKAPDGTRVFLYGAKPEVNGAAAQKLRARYPQLIVCGACDGHSGSDTSVLTELCNAKPDLVLVALGNPLQEAFIASAALMLPETAFIGVGAFFDFLAGSTPRAPPWMRALKLEWCFRLMREPQRLWRRYTVEIIVVVSALLGRRVGAALTAKAP